MKPHEIILRDFLWTVYRIKDLKILDAIKQRLTVSEQLDLERFPCIVTKEQLLVVVDSPEQLKKLVFIKKDEPHKVYEGEIMVGEQL